MTTNELAAVIGSLLTFLGGIYATHRLGKTDRSKHRVDTAAALIAGWRDYQASTAAEVASVKQESREQIAQMRHEHEVQITQLKHEYEADREADQLRWEVEKAELKEEIQRLRNQVDDLIRRERSSRDN